MTDCVYLDNGELKASIRLLGAELCSLHDCRSGEEYLWQNESGAWARTSPVLFPVVGRVRDGGFLHDGKRFAPGMHGFASCSVFDSYKHNEYEASLLFSANALTREVYPFEFALQVDFSLYQRTLHIAYTVRNRGAGTMYFSLGAHPAFALPTGAGPLSDWSVAFDAAERSEVYRIAADGALLASDHEPFVFARGNAVELSDTVFDRDALIFKNIRSRTLTLAHRHDGPRLVVDTGGAPHLGLWARPAAHYVCIEPWWGVDDDAATPLELADKPAMQTLDSGGARVFKQSYRLLSMQ